MDFTFDAISGPDFTVKLITGTTTNVDENTAYNTNLTPWRVLASTNAFGWPYHINPSELEATIASNSGIQLRQDPPAGNQMVYLYDTIATPSATPTPTPTP